MEHLLLFAVVLFAAVGLWAVLRNGPTKRLSISLHVAQTRLTRSVFGAVTLVATVGMAAQFFGWLLPRYDVELLAYSLFSLVVASFVVIALIPHVEGTWREPIHNLAAWGVVYLVPFVILSVLLSWPLSVVAFWVSLGIFAVICVLLLLALFRRKKYAPVFLYFQMAYLALFFAFLLVITYV